MITTKVLELLDGANALLVGLECFSPIDPKIQGILSPATILFQNGKTYAVTTCYMRLSVNQHILCI